MQNNQPRRKGFSLLSFFLGFLFGIIALIGAVAGLTYYALSGKVDDVLNMVGVDNSKDENGKNKVINSDKEQGGVETLLELVTKVASFASDSGNLSVGEVENLIPAVGGLVDGLHGAISGYVPVERDEFTSVKFAEFGEFVQGKILDIKPATLFDTLGMGGMLENPIMELVFVGAEAGVVVNGDDIYPVYYDVYNKSETDGKYYRDDDETELSAEYAEYLEEKNKAFRLNYYFVGEDCYITDKNEDGTYNYYAPAARSAGIVYALYNAEYSKASGNYYKSGETVVDFNPITLRTLSEGGFDTLNEIYLTEFLKNNDKLSEKLLGDITLGEILNGTVDISKVLNDLRLSDLMDVDSTDKIMTRLVYNVYDVVRVEGESKATGKYKLPAPAEGGEIKLDPDCTIILKEGLSLIERAYYVEDGKEIDILAVSVGDLQNGLDVGGLKMGEIMDVEGNMLLENLADSTIKDLPTAISSLSINEIYYKEIYKVPAKYEDDGTTVKEEAVPAVLKKAVILSAGGTLGENEIEFNSDYLYYTKDANNKMTLVDVDKNSDGTSRLGKLTADRFKDGVAKGEVYYTYGEAQGMWKILLYKTEGEDKHTTEYAYSLDKLTDMIANVSNNIQGTTLYVLHDNGIITFEHRSDLDLEIRGGEYAGKKLGELELTQALSYIVHILSQGSSI